MNDTRKTFSFYRPKPVTTPLCKDKTQRLMLFIHHDDPKYNNLSFLLHPHHDKPGLPGVFQRSIHTAKPKLKINLEKSTKEQKAERFINLNTEFINNMKNEISLIKTSNEAETPTSSHIITKTLSTFYQNKSLFSPERIEKINEINPQLGKHILKTQRTIPFSYKKMNVKFKGRFNESLWETFYASRYKKKKINIDEILIHHNSIVRKYPTPFLVKDYTLRKSTQLAKNKAKLDKLLSGNKTETYPSSQTSSNMLTLENMR